MDAKLGRNGNWVKPWSQRVYHDFKSFKEKQKFAILANERNSNWIMPPVDFTHLGLLFPNIKWVDDV